jgi:two-component system NtrC family sensor kinase
MLHEDELVGVITIFRQEVRPFTDEQISLVQNFAAQAVIAIENARLLSELRQSLEQQTATANVLEVISRSAFDLRAVFETVAESSVRLCGADRAFIFQFDGELLRMAASYNATPEFAEYVLEYIAGPLVLPLNEERSTYPTSGSTPITSMARRMSRQFGPYWACPS